MIRIQHLAVFTLLLLFGCSNSGQHDYIDNFDQLKAAKTRVSLGLTYLKNGNYSQAKFNLDKALEFAPRAADVNYAMAYYYQKVGEIELAEKSYQFAMDLEPKNADITNSYGAFLCQNGQYENAKEYFLKAVNTSNYISTAETYENLALCSQSSGQTEDTVEYLRSAVNHQPGRSNSLYLLTQALIDTQQWQEAKEILRRYERVAQVSPESLLMSIEIAKGSGQYATAKDYTDMLIKVYPQHPATISLLQNKKTVVKKSHKVLKSPAIKRVESTQKVVEKSIPVVSQQTEPAMPVESSKTPADLQEQVSTKIEQAPEATEHVVAHGENLYRISLMYNIRMQRLVEWNNLANASAIYEGMKLSLLSPNSDE